MKTINELRQAIENKQPRSAWDRGVKVYALELLQDMGGDQFLAGDRLDLDTLLNGADDWNQYSWGGCSLIYSCDIAERLCNPSELKRSKGGDHKPNNHEEWLDVQARALHQACNIIFRLAR